MIAHRIFALVSVVAVALTPAALAAQTSDSAQVDAVATLQQVVPPLDVTGLTALQFGTVNIPNGVSEGGACEYNIDAAGSMALREMNGGVQVDTSFPTPSNCAFDGELWSRGAFTIQCSPASPTTIGIEMQSAGLSGVDLLDSGGRTMVASGDSMAPQMTASGASMVVTCPDGSSTSVGSSGVLIVQVGGRLLVSEGAQPATDAVVGTVTLTASY